MPPRSPSHPPPPPPSPPHISGGAGGQAGRRAGGQAGYPRGRLPSASLPGGHDPSPLTSPAPPPRADISGSPAEKLAAGLPGPASVPRLLTRPLQTPKLRIGAQDPGPVRGARAGQVTTSVPSPPQAASGALERGPSSRLRVRPTESGGFRARSAPRRGATLSQPQLRAALRSGGGDGAPTASRLAQAELGAGRLSKHPYG
ncbi:hypothetical protein J1605_006501 [Eschrichtius robustus]|uniref:Uncharacterized protein n=1 Tax=Eschrichtius robustus TaxID=9764 RepID=A0AB34H0G4_ESCRO|nr:hypothetical protein J1605_006501 [Eschrichtius robustus]